MKDIKRLGKTMPVLLVAFMLLGGLGFAALLTHYGQIQGDVTVTEAITLELNGVAATEYTVTGIAGSTYAQGIYTITNNAEVPVTMDIVTTQSDVETCAGIETSEHDTTGILELTTKDVVFGTSPWLTNDNAKATISYTVIGNVFSWEFIDSNGIIESEYTLVYHKDKSDRWNSPEASIPVTETIGSLPYEFDANIEEYSYCDGGSEGETYLNCHGAKLWLVPTVAVYTNNKLNWNLASTFLFETDLIHYYDTEGQAQVTVQAGTLGSDIGTVTVPSGATMDFVIQNDFSLLLSEDSDCTMTTTLEPVL